MKDLKTRLEGAKKSLEELEREKIRTETRRDQLMDQLRAMGINSLEEGDAELVRIKAEAEAARVDAEALLVQFNKEYEAFL